MRILYVTGHYPPDFVSGATLQVQRLAGHAARAGHEVQVLAGAINAGLADGEVRDDVVDGVPVRWLGTATRIDQDVDANWRNDHATAAVAALVREWAPDVVHAHALQTLGADLLAEAGAAGVATVVTMHDLWWWCPRLFLVDRDLQPCALDTRTSGCACARDAAWRAARAAALQPVLGRVDLVLTPSHVLRDVVVVNGLEPSRVDVDENDVDVDVTAPPPDRGRADGPVRFLYVGGDSPLKGSDVQLEAAAMLRRHRGWMLTMHGVTEPRRRFGRRVRYVTFAPPYAPGAAASVMAAADVLVIPSIARESYSLAAREALAAGCAVITSDCLGPEEVVEHDHNGLVVPTGDASALAAAMTTLIDDRQRLRRLQAGALARPPRLRRPDEHAESLVTRYRTLIERRTASS